MTATVWAVGVKKQLMDLQTSTGVPALFAAAQFCHEGFNWDGTMSELARDHYNFAGLTFAEDGETPNWQRQFGATPASFKTREVIDGADVTVRRDFASYPNLDSFLKAYGYLLTAEGWRYTPALAYRFDPLLYCRFIANAGWATEASPTYVYAVSSHMAALWNDFVDTIPQRVYPKVTVKLDGSVIDECMAVNVDGATVGKLAPLARAIGAVVGWSQPTQTMTVKTAHLGSIDPLERERGTR